MGAGGNGDDNNGVVLKAMAVHASLAGLFFFLFQRYAMKETLETSLAWGAFFAAAAAMLAWKQTSR